MADGRVLYSLETLIDPLPFALMLPLDKSSRQQKRQRDPDEPVTDDRLPAAKRQKPTPQVNTYSVHRPPSFWDTLSKIQLTGGALREFDRRTVQNELQQPIIPVSEGPLPTGPALQRLKRFARHGGPDLAYLRGVSLSFWQMLEDLIGCGGSSQISLLR